MITLHYLQCSRSFRILWALEELGVDYQVEYYQRSPSYAAPESLKQIHPLGKAPILVDDEEVIVESAVILDYLQQQYDGQQKFKPEQAKEIILQIKWVVHVISVFRFDLRENEVFVVTLLLSKQSMKRS